MLSGMKTIVIQFIIKYNMKILKSTLILASIILFGIGLFIGSKINEQNENAKYEALRTNYIYNMQTFKFDFESASIPMQDSEIRNQMKITLDLAKKDFI